MSNSHTSSHSSLTVAERGALDGPSGTRRRVVAVTGAAQFLGSNLIGLLEEDPAVRSIVCLDSEAPSTAGAKSRVYNVSLTEGLAEERMAEILSAEQVDVVVHLAFLDSPTHSTAFAHELESVGTMHVLNACRRTKVHKIVMRSQTLLYGAHATNPNYLSEKHPLRARRSESFFADKIEAENEVLRFGRPGRGRLATILRIAPVLGPTVDNFVTRYLSHRLTPTVLGFDPLWQFVHEADAVRALRLATLQDVPGVFNIVGDGVLPLRTVIKLAGRTTLPLPRSFASGLTSALWLTQLAEAPPSFFDYLQYICVADGALAKKELGFEPLYTSREALIDYANAQHLRDVKLLSEDARVNRKDKSHKRGSNEASKDASSNRPNKGAPRDIRQEAKSPSNPKRKARRTGRPRQPLEPRAPLAPRAAAPAARPQRTEPRRPPPPPVEEQLSPVDEVGLGDTDIDSEEAFELGIGSRVVPVTTQYGEAFESTPPEPIERRSSGDVEAQIRALEARLDGLIRQREITETTGSDDDPVSQRRSPLARTSSAPPAKVEAPAIEEEGFIARKWGRGALRNRAEEFDDFGLDPVFEERVKPVVEFLYRSYFRTSVEGIDNVPAEGRCIVVANHSGALPLDGPMLRAAMRIEHPQRRDLRWLAEDFVYYLPFAGVFMNRVGAVRACPENAERLLEKESLVAVFPEGVHGIKKLFRERYRLQRFGRGGYIRLCLRMRAPIVPCAIIGAEESSPLLYRLEGLTELVGLPYFPITPTFPFLGPAGLLPAPTKWRMRFGEPIHFDNYGPEAADDHVLVGRLSERVRSSIQAMLDSGLRERRSVWFG